MRKYKICIEDPFTYCDKVYPIAQKKVKYLLSILQPEKNNNIKKIILFGSSITDRCTIDSDVDLYVELDREEKLIREYVPFDFDLWTNFQTDDNLEKEIMKKGIIIYERNIIR